MAGDVRKMAGGAREAAIQLNLTGNDQRGAALRMAADRLERERETIFAANRADLVAAEAEGLAAPLLKRLKFDEKKLATVCEGLRQLAAMDDPLNRTLYACELDDGLRLYRQTCPIGVIGMIFESRPDALVQISGLCLKSGNAVLLKGGREAVQTCRALFAAMDGAAREAGIPAGWAGLLETRQDVNEMLALDGLIDLIIPRGSNEFVRYIMEHTNIPVMGHADGICHVYVDRAADLTMAVEVALDSKIQSVATCNAAETLLVHADVAAAFLPAMAEACARAGVKLRGCPRTAAIIAVEPATDEDWSTEYLDYIYSLKVVDSLDEAIAHINRYGSHHTDAIITADSAAAERFLTMVDSAGVYHNCSTRFADGFNYGLGAEVGISTGRLHARGPVGLDGLVSYKYKLHGSGQRMADYAAGRRFTHKRL